MRAGYFAVAAFLALFFWTLGSDLDPACAQSSQGKATGQMCKLAATLTTHLKQFPSDSTAAETEGLQQQQLQAWADVMADTGLTPEEFDAVVSPQDLAALMSEVEEQAAAEAPAAQETSYSSFDIARTTLSAAGIADPVGATSVAAAYLYPTCGSPEAQSGKGDFCWKDSQTRGVGIIPTGCDAEHPEYQNGLCYALCPKGMSGEGPVCWTTSRVAKARGVGIIPNDCDAAHPDFQNGLCYAACPKGMSGEGPVCWTTSRVSQARGAGRIPRSCPSDHPDSDGGLCYKKCPSGYRGVGPVCWKGISPKGRGVGIIPNGCDPAHPDFQNGLCYAACPQGMSGEGPVCWTTAKLSQPRGAGLIPKGCPADHPEFQNGLCYASCPKDMSGEGPVCWTTETVSHPRGVGVIPTGCPADHPDYDAGLCYRSCSAGGGVGPVCWMACTGRFGEACGAGCATDQLACGLATTDMVASPLEMVTNILSLGTASAETSAARTARKAAREAADKAADAAKKVAKAEKDAIWDAAKSGDAWLNEFAKQAREQGLNSSEELAELATKLERASPEEAASIGTRMANSTRAAYKAAAAQAARSAAYIRAHGGDSLYAVLKKLPDYTPKSIAQRKLANQLDKPALTARYLKKLEAAYDSLHIKQIAAADTFIAGCAKLGLTVSRESLGEVSN